MRVARIALDDGPRVAVIDGEQALPLAPGVGVLELLNADAPERARLIESAAAPIALAAAQLLAPILPASVRDFSVFEQHIEGAVRWRNPAGTIPPAWYEGPSATSATRMRSRAPAKGS